MPWSFSKARLGDLSRPAMVLSKDIPHGAGSKTFLKTFAPAAYVLTLRNEPGVYEVIPDARELTYVFFDFDLSIPDGGSGWGSGGGRCLTSEVVSAGLEPFGLGIDSLGSRAQACVAHGLAKFSVHLKVNCLVRFGDTEALSRKVSERVEERTGVSASVDTGVYTPFRSVRVLYSSKEGSNRPLVPWGGSSRHLEDHLVRVYPWNPQEAAPPPKILPQPLPPPSRRGAGALAGWRGDGCGDSEYAAHLLRRAADNSGLPAALGLRGGDSLLFDSIRSGAGRVSAFVSRRCPHDCPFKGGAHRSNRGLVSASWSTGTVAYRCTDPECAGMSSAHPFYWSS